MPPRAVTAADWSACALLWMLSVAASLISANRYALPVAVALGAAAAFAWCSARIRRATGRLGRAALLALEAPLLLLACDNVGRALAMLGGPGFRLLGG